MKRLIYLAKNYDLVVGDEFQLFYRGIIKSMNPYKYYIRVISKKGKPYPRYYSYTPKEDEVGDYPLEVSLINDYGEVIETATTTLHVNNIVKPRKKVNILCFGDSLTFNGVWPYIGYSRFSEVYPNTLNFIGTCKKDKIGYEGYGGWQWRHFVKDEAVPMTASVWVCVDHHNLDENDQHSIWVNEGLKWVLESIEEKRLKFKRGDNNFSCLPKVSNTFTNLEGGVHKDPININKYYFEQGNPFYDKTLDGPNFKKYVKDNHFEGIDYVYILLTWNGQEKQYNDDFSHYEPYICSIIDSIHKDYKLAKIRLIGVQSPSITGGIASNYGATGPYSDVFGTLTTIYNYNMYLESLCERSEYKDFCKYVDMKAEFDIENNMPTVERKVNARSEKLELIGTNGVHPTMEGYNQIGDCFYRTLVSDMNLEK